MAGISLNIFNRHCSRVQMANIAQTVNVLQAMVLTEGEKMLLTPTYHVFSMYKVHQNSELLDIHFDSPNYVHGEESIPQVDVSASIDIEQKIHISICNLHPECEANISIEITNFKAEKVSGTILTSEKINAHNTFEEPNLIKPSEFKGAIIKENTLEVSVPPKSVTVLELA